MIKFLVDLNANCSDYAVASTLNLAYKIFKMILNNKGEKVCIVNIVVVK